MTDRGLPPSDAATACPFVAFEDDRDERSDRPDHRHRCYADVHPAPRAIAHQEAYCLSAAFAVCPTFQDWAQREAARARGAGPTGTGAGHAARDAVADREPDPADVARDAADARERDRVSAPGVHDVPAAEWQGSRPSRQEDTGFPLPPRRNPPRDWAAPPPWAGGPRDSGPGAAAGAAGAAGLAGPAGLAGAAGAAAAGAGAAGAGPPGARAPGAGPAGAGAAGAGSPRAGPSSGSEAPPFLADRESRGLAGSAADRIAGGEPVPTRPPERPQSSPRPEQIVPSRSTERAQAADEELAGLVRRRDAGTDAPDRGAAVVPPAAVAGTAAAGVAGTAGAAGTAGTDTPAGATPRRPAPPPRVDAEEAPHWEQPRRYEAYPTIKTRTGMGGLPRLGVMAAALGIAALALFLLPAALNLFGDDPGGGPTVPGAGSTASPTVGAETASPVPTAPAAPTPQIYIIKSGDTLSRIASQFNVSLEDLLEANRENIPDPNKISIGDEVIIPVPEPDALPDASTAP